MPTPTKQTNPYLTRLSTVCLALPEASITPQGDHCTFRVRSKVFAYFLNNHHGDGIVAVCVRCPPGDNEDWIRTDPKRFYLPAYIGVRGWLGVRLDVGRVPWRAVADFVNESYRLAAPRTLVATMPKQKA